MHKKKTLPDMNYFVYYDTVKNGVLRLQVMEIILGNNSCELYGGLSNELIDQILEK